MVPNINQGKRVMNLTDNLLKRITAMKPKSFYGIGKLSSEEYIRIFSEEGLNSTIFRLFNVYGPGQDLKNLKQGMVSIYLSYILQNKPILVNKNDLR